MMYQMNYFIKDNLFYTLREVNKICSLCLKVVVNFLTKNVPLLENMIFLRIIKVVDV
jgi:hypothetical protein